MTQPSQCCLWSQWRSDNAKGGKLEGRRLTPTPKNFERPTEVKERGDEEREEEARSKICYLSL